MTTDEAMFNLGGSYGRRWVCYIRKGHGDPSKLNYVKSDSFAPGFLAWALVSSQAKLRLGSSLKVSRSIQNFILAKFLNHSLNIIKLDCF